MRTASRVRIIYVDVVVMECAQMNKYASETRGTWTIVTTLQNAFLISVTKIDVLTLLITAQDLLEL